jgi:hypothetical protein
MNTLKPLIEWAQETESVPESLLQRYLIQKELLREEVRAEDVLP